MPPKVEKAIQVATQKNHNFFSSKIYFCLHTKLQFILLELVMRKLWTILFFGQSKHLLEKIAYGVQFLMQFQ